MWHYNLSVESTLFTTIENDEINEDYNYTQIVTVKLRNQSAHKIYKNNSFNEIDLILQSNTFNKASNEFATDQSCEKDELHITNIFKDYEMELLNDTHFDCVRKCECTKYIKKNELITNWISYCTHGKR